MQKLFAPLVLFLSGCAILRASPAQDTGFLPHGDKLTSLEERSPFHGVWYADRVKLDEMKKNYRSFYIMPVNTEYLESKIRANPDHSESWKNERVEDLHEIARYMQERLKNAIKEYPNHPMKVVDEVGPKTFVFQSALIELNPTNPAVNTIGTAAGFFVPGGSLISLAGRGSVAMEAILRDGESGDSLVEIRDRQSDKTAPVTIKDYQMYAHDREAIDDWADTLAELAATNYSHKVDAPLPVTLNPF